MAFAIFIFQSITINNMCANFNYQTLMFDPINDPVNDPVNDPINSKGLFRPKIFADIFYLPLVYQTCCYTYGILVVLYQTCYLHTSLFFLFFLNINCHRYGLHKKIIAISMESLETNIFNRRFRYISVILYELCWLIKRCWFH